MSARTWNEGDPEPADHPAIVDDDGVTWLWMVDPADDPDTPAHYVRRIVTRHEGVNGGPGGLVGGPMGQEWDEILADYGPVREATTDEAETFTHRFPGRNILEPS